MLGARIPWRPVAKIALLVCTLVLAHVAVNEITAAFDFEIRPGNEDMVHRIIMSAAVLYTLLLAIPFVPGAEIGLTMIAVLGPPIAVLVYACTVAGLTLAFLIGRLLPFGVLVRASAMLGLRGFSDQLAAMEPLEPEAKLTYATRHVPGRYAGWVVRYRFVTLAVLLNVPGNAVIGGGGGIAMIAGLSRLFPFYWYLPVVMLAVLPVPLSVLIFGVAFLPE